MAGDELRLSGLERLQRVGAGGFGTVYRAWQPEFGRWVAVKVMADVLGGDDDRRRFERERIATGSLSAHPSIVTVYDHGTTAEGRPYIVMELLEGGTLADRIADEGPLAPEVVLEVGIGLAGALAAAHDAQVLHRDVKPENVLFSGYGTAALADFGIARLPGATATRSGVITASLSHAPPEVLNGDGPTTATDVYGLASTLWAAAVGRAPFQRGGDEPLAALVARIATAPPPDAEAHGVPGALATVLTRGLAKDPTKRPESAAAFGRDLQAAQEELGLATTPLVLGGAANSAGPGGAAPNTDDEITRPRAVVPAAASAGSDRRRTLAALVAVLLVAGTAGGWALSRSGEEVPVVAAPSEADGDVAGTPSPLGSAHPSAAAATEPSPSPTDAVLSGETFPPGDGSSRDATGSGRTGPGSTSGDTGTGGDDTDEPTSTTSPTPAPQSSPSPTKSTSPTSSPSPPPPANRAPTLTGGGTDSTDERQVVSRTLTASDPDGDALTIKVTSGSLPPGVTLSGPTVAGTVTRSAVGGYTQGARFTYTATITAQDPDGLSDSVQVSWTVSNTHFAMPDYYYSYGDGSDGLPDVGSGIFSQSFDCTPGATDPNDQSRIVEQSVAADTTVAFGVAVTFTYWQETC